MQDYEKEPCAECNEFRHPITTDCWDGEQCEAVTQFNGILHWQSEEMQRFVHAEGAGHVDESVTSAWPVRPELMATLAAPQARR